MKQVIKISQVKNNPNNPRVIKDHDFYVLVNSIKTTPGFMEFRPVIIDYNNMVLCGNQRLRACIYLGHKEIWTDLFTQEKADEMNKEAQKEGRPTKTYLEYCKAITIVDNTHAGTWDWDILANEWEQTELEGWGLDGFPFEDKTLEAEEDNFEVPDEIKTDIVLGDLFEIGEHRLLCGDSTDSDQVAKLMNGEKADLMVTDPPYNVAYEGKTKEKLTIKNDKKNSEDFYKFLYDFFVIYNLFIKEGGVFYVWQSDKEAHRFIRSFEESGCKYSGLLIWVKNSLVMGMADYHSKHETCIYGWKEGASHNWYSDRKQTTVLEFDRPSRSSEHPTMKPVELISYQIKNSSKKNDLVCDAFLGSGTTMVASHQLKRKCYGMELDPKYCQVIIDRMRKLDPNLVIKRNGINIE
jgi:DNA modification methylase